MSRRSKAEVIQELIYAYRESQIAVDEMDDAATRALGINRSDARCLDVLDREGAVTAGRLAEASGLTTAAVTAVIDRLERAGYARRRPDPDDRRRVVVEMTPLARERAEVLYGPLAEGVKYLQKYSIEELQLMTEFARRSTELNRKRAAEVRELRFD